MKNNLKFDFSDLNNPRMKNKIIYDLVIITLQTIKTKFLKLFSEWMWGMFWRKKFNLLITKSEVQPRPISTWPIYSETSISATSVSVWTMSVSKGYFLILSWLEFMLPGGSQPFSIWWDQQRQFADRLLHQNRTSWSVQRRKFDAARSDCTTHT